MTARSIPGVRPFAAGFMRPALRDAMAMDGLAAVEAGRGTHYAVPDDVGPLSPRLLREAFDRRRGSGAFAMAHATPPLSDIDGLMASMRSEVGLRLSAWVAGGSAIHVFGDYDADGIASTTALALLVAGLRGAPVTDPVAGLGAAFLTAGVFPIVPERSDGYGLSAAWVRRLSREAGPKGRVRRQRHECRGGPLPGRDPRDRGPRRRPPPTITGRGRMVGRPAGRRGAPQPHGRWPPRGHPRAGWLAARDVRRGRGRVPRLRDVVPHGPSPRHPMGRGPRGPRVRHGHHAPPGPGQGVHRPGPRMLRRGGRPGAARGARPRQAQDRPCRGAPPGRPRAPARGVGPRSRLLRLLRGSPHQRVRPHRPRVGRTRLHGRAGGPRRDRRRQPGGGQRPPQGHRGGLVDGHLRRRGDLPRRRRLR